MGGEDALEIWPSILEKAYAKLYGSYSNIEAGKVHLALADMVEGGFPEVLTLKDFSSNLRLFNGKLRQLDKVQALMGAGTTEGKDTESNGEGIVKGHAYSILEVADYMGEQLIQLRNPHGYRGLNVAKEWTGEWADDSEKWTTKAMASLEYTPNTGESDGVFWMPSLDFINNFKYIYICRELSEKAGWYSHAI